MSRSRRFLALAFATALAAAALLAVPARAAAPTPRLVAIRAAHHPGYDRVVFEFRGGLPAHSVRLVDELVGDPSGLPVRIAGRGVLQARFSPADAHDAQGNPTVSGRTTYALPNVLTTVRAGDSEAVTTYGIGLAKRTTFRVFTLRDPARVVVDVRAAFRNRSRPVRFLDEPAFVGNRPPFVVPRSRLVRVDRPLVGLMDRLFAGVLPGEYANGLRLLRSGATDYRRLGIEDGVARIQLLGGCDSDGSTVTIADEIMPTLRPLPAVRWVKIYDPAGTTERPTGQSDSIPACLEP